MSRLAIGGPGRRSGRSSIPFLPIIQQILEADRSAPKKQRHTAKRIFQRLRDEHGFTGGYTIVKDAVRAWKQAHQEVFLPLSHPPGEAQVDFGFAEAIVRWRCPTKVALFVMTLPYSGRGLHPGVPSGMHRDVPGRPSPGVRVLRRGAEADQLRQHQTAVAEITGAAERKLTREFLRLQSHYLFQEHFCLVRRPNEKGHVERLLGFARSNFLVPGAGGRIPGRAERPLGRAVPPRPGPARPGQAGDGRDAAGRGPGRVPAVAEAAVRGPARRPRQRPTRSRWCGSTPTTTPCPTQYAHRQLTVVATVEEVRLVYEDRLVARHPRCWDREQYLFEPIHYLALLERKPGGFDYARPLEDWELPECFALLRRRLEAADRRHGTRSFIRVLRLLETFSLPQLTEAVEYALDIDVIDPDSIRMIVEHRADRPVELFPLDGRPHLRAVRVEPTDVSAYQALLAGGDAMNKTETKSTVLLKHHLKALKLPTIRRVREGRPAGCRRQRRSPGVPAAAVRAGADRAGAEGGRAAAEGRPLPGHQDARRVRLRRPAERQQAAGAGAGPRRLPRHSGRTSCWSARAGRARRTWPRPGHGRLRPGPAGPLLPRDRADHAAAGGQRGAPALAAAAATWPSWTC